MNYLIFLFLCKLKYIISKTKTRKGEKREGVGGKEKETEKKEVNILIFSKMFLVFILNLLKNN